MARPRHPFHDKIVDMLLERIPYKVIAHKCQASLKTVGEIADNYTELVRIRKPDPGEGQKSFFDVWKVTNGRRRLTD